MTVGYESLRSMTAIPSGYLRTWTRSWALSFSSYLDCQTNQKIIINSIPKAKEDSFPLHKRGWGKIVIRLTARFLYEKDSFLPCMRSISRRISLLGYSSNCQRQPYWNSYQHNMLHLFALVLRLASSARNNHNNQGVFNPVQVILQNCGDKLNKLSSWRTLSHAWESHKCVRQAY